MKKFLTTILLGISLTACGSEGVSSKEVTSVILPPPQMVVEDTYKTSTWWLRPQYYNGIPKYSGAFGTYTHKHIPLSVKVNGDLFHVRTDNTQDNNFYVYAMKNDQEVVVHTIENWDDPHTNAVINVLPSGHVMVHVASRGLNHKFQSGKVFKSKTPYELDFECIDGCVSDNYEAYPQVHNTAWGYHLIYTHYEHEPDAVGIKSKRRSWSKVNGVRQKLSNKEHYQISYYSEEAKELCVARNLLIDSSPDIRVGVRVMCTTNGTTWRNMNGDFLNVPVDFDGESVVYSSYRDDWEEKHDYYYAYLKDIYYYNGKWRVLFTKSDSDDPTEGKRYLVEWVEGETKNDRSPNVITEVGHNYSAGAYLEKDGKLYIVAGKSNTPYYLSGNLELYTTDYQLVDTLEGEFSYVRRTFKTDGHATLSEGDAANPETIGRHLKLILK